VIVLVAIVDIVELCLLACTWRCVFDTHIGDETEHTAIGDVELVILVNALLADVVHKFIELIFRALRDVGMLDVVHKFKSCLWYIHLQPVLAYLVQLLIHNQLIRTDTSEQYILPTSNSDMHTSAQPIINSNDYIRLQMDNLTTMNDLILSFSCETLEVWVRRFGRVGEIVDVIVLVAIVDKVELQETHSTNDHSPPKLDIHSKLVMLLCMIRS
jgi:hypothetical protein